MDPTWVLFWCVVALELGFLVAYAWLGRDAAAGIAVLAGFCSICTLVQYALGSPGWPVFVSVATTIGLGVGAHLQRSQYAQSFED